MSGKFKFAGAPEATVWLQEHLPAIMEGYRAPDNYDGYETGLVYQLLPDHTLALRGDFAVVGSAVQCASQLYCM